LEVLEQIDPWGPKRADYRAAVTCWTIACCHHSGKGRGPQLKDFLKYFDFEPREEKTDADFIEKMKSKIKYEK
jgi:hypothetical protein